MLSTPSKNPKESPVKRAVRARQEALLEAEAGLDAVVSLRPGFVSVERAALWFDVSGDTVRRLIDRGELRVVRLGRRVLIPVEELERLKAEWIEAAKRPRRA